MISLFFHALCLAGSNAIVVHRPLSSFPLLVCHPILRAVIVCRCHCSLLLSSARHHRCHHPPSPLSLSASIVIHRRHLPPLKPSLPLRVSTVSCRPLLSVPFVVRHPISHAVVVHRCRCLPSPLSSVAAIFRHCSHHHHSAVSAVSHCPLLSFPIAVCCPPPNHACRRRPPPSSSATVVVRRRRTYTRPPLYKMLIVAL